jgi:hypothetical protein
MTGHTLIWHREYRPGGRKRVVTGVKAWATDLDPEASLPPYYRIERVSENQSLRRVLLINCRVCGGDRVKIDLADDLKAAKGVAQADYDKRLAEQALTNP